MPTSRSTAPAPATSLFQFGIGPRLAMAAILSGAVWLAIAWALAA